MITVKVVIIFPHTSRLVSLNRHVRLCTVSHLFNQQRTNSSHTPASFSPLAQRFHYVVPSFHRLRLKLQGQNKWLRWRTKRPAG